MRALLLVAAIFAMLAAAQQPQGTASLEGRVTEAGGRPVEKAGLTLAGQPGSQPYRVYQTISGPDGSFSFTGVDPGTYWLRAERAGYLRAEYRASPHETISPIALAAGRRSNPVNVTMTRSATISGRVLDGNGDPVESAQVQVLRRVFRPGFPMEAGRFANTDQSGSLSGIEALQST